MKHLWLILVGALLSFQSFAVTTTTIDGLPSAATLTGVEPLPVVQGGNAVQTTPGAINTYVQSQLSSSFIIGLFSACSGTQYLGADGACHNGGGGSGTVTSVAFSAPSIFSVAGSPVTTSGTLALSFATGQTQNEVLASPNGSSGAVSLRALVAADIPAISLTSGVSGVLPVANGGSGVGTLTGPIKGNGTSAFTAAAASDIVGLFSTCSGAQYLGADGSCHNAGGSVAGGNTQIQLNNSGSFGASSAFAFNLSTNVLTFGALGTPASIVSPSGSSNLAGANITIQGGAGAGSGQGADLIFNAGNYGGGAATGNGGRLLFTAGTSNSGDEGNLQFNAPNTGEFNIGVGADNITPFAGATLNGVSVAASKNFEMQVVMSDHTTSSSASFEAQNSAGSSLFMGINDTTNTTSPLANGPASYQTYLYTNDAAPLLFGTSANAELMIDANFNAGGNSNFVVGLGASATANSDGFFYAPKVAGVPTGVPLHLTGVYGNSVPTRIDTTDNRYYIYNSGWKNIADASSITGTLAVSNGGTGIGTLTGLALGNGTSAMSAYSGTSCSNQFPRSLNASGAATCASVGLTTDVSGILPSANGGTANGFFTVSGPASSAKTFTFPNASGTVAMLNVQNTFANNATSLTGQTISNSTSTGTAGAFLDLLNSAGASDAFQIVLTRPSYGSSILGNGPTGEQVAIWTNSFQPIAFGTDGQSRLIIPSDGTAVNHQTPVAYTAYSLQVPTTGFSITMANTAGQLLLNPAGTLATGTVTMPATPVNGLQECIATSQTITSLTISANSGQTIATSTTTLVAGKGVCFIYNLSGTKWYQIS